MEARTYTRVATKHPATITTADGTTLQGTLRDVALRGVFVSGVQLPIQTAVTIRIDLSPVACIEGSGQVARATPDGIGVTLELLADSDSLEHLRHLVLLNTRTSEETTRVAREIDRHLPPPPA